MPRLVSIFDFLYRPPPSFVLYSRSLRRENRRLPSRCEYELPFSVARNLCSATPHPNLISPWQACAQARRPFLHACCLALSREPRTQFTALVGRRRRHSRSKPSPSELLFSSTLPHSIKHRFQAPYTPPPIVAVRGPPLWRYGGGAGPKTPPKKHPKTPQNTPRMPQNTPQTPPKHPQNTLKTPPQVTPRLHPVCSSRHSPRTWMPPIPQRVLVTLTCQTLSTASQAAPPQITRNSTTIPTLLGSETQPQGV